MHRALTIPEIVLGIAEYVDDRASLVSLATTCWAFRGLAERALWAKPSEEQVVRLAEFFLSHERGDSTDCDVLRRYQARLSFVRDVQLRGNRNLTANEEQHSKIRPWLIRPGHVAPFPMLERMCVTLYTPEDFALVRALLCPSLKDLEVNGPCGAAKMRSKRWRKPTFSFFRAVSAVGGRIERLDLNLWIAISLGYEKKVAGMLKNLPRLRVYQADGVALHPVVLDALSRSDILEELRIRAWIAQSEMTVRDSLRQTFQQCRLPALRLLECALDFELTAAFINVVHMKLETLELQTWPGDITSQDRHLASLFRSLAECDRLRFLDISMDSRPSHDSTEQEPAMTFPSLAKLPGQLEIFKLSYLWPATMAVGDADIEKIASGCPALTELALDWGLSYYTLGRSPHTITFQSLITLGTQCPHLKRLKLPNFDTTIHVPLPPTPTTLNSTEITICESQEPTYEPEYVADFFASAWPNADIHCGDILSEGDDLLLTWEHAVDLFYEKTASTSSFVSSSNASEDVDAEDNDDVATSSGVSDQYVTEDVEDAVDAESAVDHVSLP